MPSFNSASVDKYRGHYSDSHSPVMFSYLPKNTFRLEYIFRNTQAIPICFTHDGRIFTAVKVAASPKMKKNGGMDSNTVHLLPKSGTRSSRKKTQIMQYGRRQERSRLSRKEVHVSMLLIQKLVFRLHTPF